MPRVRPREAKAAFEELLKQYPNDADLHLFLGMSLLRLRDPQAAVLAIKRAIGIDPTPCRSANPAGLCRVGNPRRCRRGDQRVSQSYRAQPDRAEAYSNLAVAQKKKGDSNKRSSSLNKALELKPDFVGALTTRGGIFADSANGPKRGAISKQRSSSIRSDDGALYGLSQSFARRGTTAARSSALSDLISRSANFVYWLEWGRIGLIRYWWVLL